MERVILHSDLNSFYASVELLYRPELRGKPVAVAGDPQARHGIILTANPIAKARGVKTGDAIWQARQKCPQLAILPPDYDKYLRFSRMARAIYLDYTDMVEPFGIDEAWLDVTGSVGICGSGERIADEIRRRIREELGVTASVGVSFNKTFAKLGSDYKKPDATTCVTRENFRSLVWPLPTKELLYVGPATFRKLHDRGVWTIGQLAALDPETAQRWLGKVGLLLWRSANGQENGPVCRYGDEAVMKSVGNSATTPRDLTTDEDVRLMLTILADSVAERLRDQGFYGRTLSLTLRDTELVSVTRQRRLVRPTCLTGEIVEAAAALFGESYRWERPLRSIGISLSDFCYGNLPIQMDIFCDQAKREAQERLERTVDCLRRRYGHAAVRRGVVLADHAFAGMNPKDGHTIHPVGYLKGGSAP